MNATITALDAGFLFAVVGAAMTPWPWLALFVGFVWMVALVVVTDRRTPPEIEKPGPERPH